MDVRIIVETTAETGEKRTKELHHLSLTDQCHRELGLKLEQGKALLVQLQGSILRHQIEEISAASRTCLCCGRSRPVHDYRTRVLDTLYGRLQPMAAIWNATANCEATRERPLLTEPTESHWSEYHMTISMV